MVLETRTSQHVASRMTLEFPICGKEFAGYFDRLRWIVVSEGLRIHGHATKMVLYIF